ncbi:MAG: hypothetical protein V4671_16310 [Armatimonadota bacterium]
MGWKTDWLYILVFGLVHDLWAETNHFAEQMTEQNRLQAPQANLDALRVYQCEEADLTKGFCQKPILHEWVYDGSVFTEGVPEEARRQKQQHNSHPFAVLPTSQEIRGTLFTEGMVWFYITVDRKHVLFTYQVGPRFGRRMKYRVEGQEQSGRLALERHCWIS